MFIFLFICFAGAKHGLVRCYRAIFYVNGNKRHINNTKPTTAFIDIHISTQEQNTSNKSAPTIYAPYEQKAPSACIRFTGNVTKLKPSNAPTISSHNMLINASNIIYSSPSFLPPNLFLNCIIEPNCIPC